MINREVTKKDIMIYLLIILIITAGFSNTTFPITFKLFPKRIHYILAPFAIAVHLLTPKTSIIIGLIIFIYYTSVRFFNSQETRFFIVFGGMLYLGYRYDDKLVENLSLFHATAIVAVPQLINTLVYTIFKDRRVG